MNIKTINAYWWNSVTNFGDLLTESLLEKYNIKAMHSTESEAELFGVGSILSRIHDDYSGFILGTGIMHPRQRSFKKAKILSVRGTLTRQCLNLSSTTPIGDPGLLSDLLLDKRSEKKFTLGIIPHFQNSNDDKVINFSNKYADDVKVIDVKRSPVEVIKEIDQCHYIASSSLHGLIVADSLGIPNTWLHISKEVGGGEFKFIDYGTAISRKPVAYNFLGTERLSEIISSTTNPSTAVNDTKAEVDSTFKILYHSIK